MSLIVIPAEPEPRTKAILIEREIITKALHRFFAGAFHDLCMAGLVPRQKFPPGPFS